MFKAFEENNRAVRIRNVSKAFGAGDNKVQALSQVDFYALAGEITMITGPSGCGKTTLLSVVAGTLCVNEGEVEVFNTLLHDLSDFQLASFRRKNIGFIFQHYNLVRTLTCAENVSIPLILNGVNRRIAIEKAMRLLEQVGLKDHHSKFPKNLSGGQQQRVAIARALVHEPNLIVCDEPTAALDAENGLKVMELLRTVVKSPERSVVIVTHDNRIYKYADRIVKMDDGRIESTKEVNSRIYYD